MRIHRVLHPVVVLSIVVAAWTQAGCDKPCNPECGSNERCIDQSCVHCGLPGEKCCYDNAGTFVCDTGECNNAGTNVCPGGSQSGSQCVEGTCPDGGSCVDGMCESPADPCYDGTTAYTFDLVDSDCFKLSFTFYVNSQQEAEQCASDEVEGRSEWRQADPGLSRGPRHGRQCRACRRLRHLPGHQVADAVLELRR